MTGPRGAQCGALPPLSLRPRGGCLRSSGIARVGPTSSDALHSGLLGGGRDGGGGGGGGISLPRGARRGSVLAGPYPSLYTLHFTPYTLLPTPYTPHPTPHTLNPQPYRGTSLTRKCPPLAPNSSHVPRDLWWSYGGEALSNE